MLCRAKVNLTLHVGAAQPAGRWAGYHPIESLVIFADIGDTLRTAPSQQTTLAISGPFGDGLEAGSDNLVLQALRACRAAPQHIILDKRLPVSAGLGGGSANAAAILRRFDPQGRVDAATLGADVPVCRLSHTAMMEGIGETVTPLPGLGQVPAVLVNPGVAISTAEIFKAFDAADPAIRPARTLRSGSLLTRALSGRNDLEDIATAQAPVIADILDRLRLQDGCRLARMSGSGATCFGLFDTAKQAHLAAEALSRLDWWSVATLLGEAA